MTGPGTPVDVHEGQAAYTPWTLRFYDLAIFQVNCRFFWRVPVRELLALFDRNLADVHLDIGVGTGYLLDRCRAHAPRQAVTLADLNEHSLRHAARRLARYQITTVRADALRALPLPPGCFGSASVNFLLHCLPGTIRSKAAVLDHAAACVRPGGRLFGATVLARGVRVTAGARAQLALLNRRGVFHNAHDSLADLRTELAARFPSHRIAVFGCTAVFEAEVP
ncbi:class I SAM-dependent methyltransferase [Streptomyces sp. NPDC001083]|uniref:class I SAM-dependent methyltransferase n=1 Tax=Streptomyces sp. NPDC001083 TaxID=3364545 RepID=UPI0036A0890E